jgi:hypothetical protein
VHERALRLLGDRALALLLGVGAEAGEQVAVLDAGRARGHARLAAEAVVDRVEHLLERERALEDLLHQEDPPARGVLLAAERDVGRARRQAEAAVHAAADRVRHRLALRAQRRGVDVMTHLSRPPGV